MGQDQLDQPIAAQDTARQRKPDEERGMGSGLVGALCIVYRHSPLLHTVHMYCVRTVHCTVWCPACSVQCGVDKKRRLRGKTLSCVTMSDSAEDDLQDESPEKEKDDAVDGGEEVRVNLFAAPRPDRIGMCHLLNL